MFLLFEWALGGCTWRNCRVFACLKMMLEKGNRAHLSRKPVTVAACVHTITLYSADFRVPLDSMSANIMNPDPTEETSKKAYEEAGNRHRGPGRLQLTGPVGS